ncbi:kelch repeat-containing protein, partial [Patescibacteria group bacterium]
DNSLKAKGRIGLDSRRAGKVFVPSPLTFMEKLEVFYLAPYYLQAFFFIIGTLSWLISETIFQVKLPFWTELWGWSLVLTNLFSLPLMNAVGMFLEEAEEKDYIGILSFMLLCYILVPFQAYAAVKGLLKKDEGPWFRTPKTGKVTDVFTRGQFYRWISGIIPGKRPSFAANMSGLKGTPGVEIALTDHPRGGAKTRAFLPGGGLLGKLGKLFGLAPKAWQALELRPAQVRLLAKLSLVILLVTSIGLSWLTPTVPLVHAAPDTFYFHDFGADYLASTPTDGKYWMDSTAADTNNEVKSFTLDSSGDTYYTLTDNMNKRWQRYEGGDDTWEETGNLVGDTDYGGRYMHTATLLNNGKVLAVGGYNNVGLYFSSAQLYDPSTNTWSNTTNLLGGDIDGKRDSHTATLLNNGQVLVVGGRSDNLSSAQLYDSDTGTWTRTSNLLGGTDYGGRQNHTATLLNDGKVLVAGGDGSSDTFSSAQLYDPSTGTWANTGNLIGGATNGARNLHTATLLDDGKVLVSGGLSGASALSSAQIYDPATGTWEEVGNLIGDTDYGRRHQHRATLLNNGKVLVSGGKPTTASLPISSAQIYDPATKTWTQTSNLIGDTDYGNRNIHTATLLNNGKVLVSGGAASGAITISSAQLYDPSTGTWSETDDLIGGGTNGKRYNHTATLLNNGKVLVSGGLGGGSNYLSSSQIFSPSRQNDLKVSPNAPPNAEQRNPDVAVDSTGNTFVVWEDNRNSLDQNVWAETGNLSTGRGTGEQSVLLSNGMVLTAGGRDGSNYLSSAEIYDPTVGDWTVTGNFIGGTSYGIRNRFALTLLDNGQALAIGGWNTPGGVEISSSQLYNPSTGTWAETGNLLGGEIYGDRTDHAATLLNNGQVLVAGGISDYYISSSQLYDPGTGTWRETGNLINDRRDHTLTLLHNGKVLLVGDSTDELSACELYDPVTGTWEETGTLLGGTSYGGRKSHGATILKDGRALVVGGTNAAGTDLSSAQLYDPSTGTWEEAGNLVGGTVYGARDSIEKSLVTLNNGKVLLAGGETGAAVELSSAQIYDPATGTWEEAGDMVGQRSRYSSTLLNNGQVLVFGGTGAATLSSSELFTPETYDIYMQKFNTSGTPAWIEDKRVNSD